MFEQLSERQQELTFSLTLLLTVGLGFAAVEESARMYRARLIDADVDWNSMVDNVGYVKDGEKLPRFQPNTQFKHLSFNNLGFRGPTLPEVAAPNTVRIAYLGNSILFGGEFDENQTIAARTTEVLKSEIPNCNFEYATIAGPSYSMDFLAQLWSEAAPSIHPDMAIVLAGTVQEMVRAHDAKADPKDYIGQQDGGATSVFDKSAAIAMLRRQLVLTSPVASDFGNAKYNIQSLSVSYDNMIEKLTQVTKGTPVIAAAYRSALRTEQAPKEQLWASRSLRASVPGLDVDQALELSNFIVEQMERVSARVGWKFIDPLKDIPGDRDHFRDFTHLTDKGMDQLAHSIASEVKSRVTPNCKIGPMVTASQ